MNRLTFTKEFKKHEEIGHILCLKPEKLIEWEEKLSQYEDIGEPKELIKRPSLDENGLAQCGCGGVTEQTDFHDGFFSHSKVECLECGIEIMRAGNIIAEAHDEAKMAWNTAMNILEVEE